MEDCKYQTEDCDNATVCPCLLFIKNQTEEYSNMLQSDFWTEITEELW